MEKYGALVAVGIVAILMIVIASIGGLSPHIVRGIIFTAISILLIIASAAAWSAHWIVGLAALIGAIVFFVLAGNAFSQVAS